jgi:hypothetical protein
MRKAGPERRADALEQLAFIRRSAIEGVQGMLDATNNADPRIGKSPIQIEEDGLEWPPTGAYHVRTISNPIKLSSPAGSCESEALFRRAIVRINQDMMPHVTTIGTGGS